MKMGTKSLLFGVHQFALHPLFCAWGWWNLYGWRAVPLYDFPPDSPPVTSLRDWRLWLSFLVHDWGYWGCETMDGDDGCRHPAYGADLLWRVTRYHYCWYIFVAGHSRTFARERGLPTSALMPADKLATALMPTWLYVLLCWLPGEWYEYVALDRAHGYEGPGTLWAWARYKRQEWGTKFGKQEGVIER